MIQISENIKRTRIKEELARRIVNGEFSFGERFPGLHDLSREYSVSYVTVSKAVKLLDATPTAPVVHYKFYYMKSKSYNIDINLNKFNSVAAILRRMECLLFIIGLATATRRIYLRG